MVPRRPCALFPFPGPRMAKMVPCGFDNQTQHCLRRLEALPVSHWDTQQRPSAFAGRVEGMPRLFHGAGGQR